MLTVLLLKGARYAPTSCQPESDFIPDRDLDLLSVLHGF